MIYLIFDKKSKLTKIGCSKNPFRRLSTLKIGNPSLELVYYSGKYTEEELHEKYVDKRVSGEWFKLDLNDYKEIIGHINGLPKTLYYRNGFPKFIIESKKYLNTKEKKKVYPLHGVIPKWIIEGHDLYFIDSENKVRNIRTGKTLQMQLKGYTRGYYLNGRFFSLKQIRARLRKYEEQVTPF